jgi:hypothetical protein
MTAAAPLTTTDPPSARAADPVAPVVASPSADSAVGAASAEAMMQEIRTVVKSNPALAERLVREHRRLYPESHDADERDAFLVASVYNQRRFDRARLEARKYLEQHPDGGFVDYVRKLAGMHVDSSP